jgi:hypothetical protein
MNRSLLITSVVCVAAGFAAGYGTRQQIQHQAEGREVTVLKDKVASLEKAHAAAQHSVKAQTALDAHTQPTAAEIAESEADQKRFEERDKRRQEKVKKVLMDRKKLKIAERLRALQNRLGLDASQAEALAKILEQQMTDNTDKLLQEMTNPSEAQGPEKELEMALEMIKGGNDKALNESISQLLNPTQQEAFTQFQQEEKSNKVEQKANKELSRLQGSMSLTSAQKDQAFAVLSQLAAEDLDNPTSAIPQMMMMHGDRFENVPNGDKIKAEAARYQEAQAKKLAAMKTVLSPEQYQIYEGQLQAGSMTDMMESMMGDMPPDLFMFGQEAESEAEATASDAAEQGFAVPANP